MAQLNRTERVACRTPAVGRTGVTRIPKWKFDCIRGAVLDVLKQEDTPWKDLTDRVRERLEESELEAMGSLGWHVVTVKLELEVRGEISRSAGPGRQILTLGDGAS